MVHCVKAKQSYRRAYTRRQCI